MAAGTGHFGHGRRLVRQGSPSSLFQFLAYA
jgi:hypothetical protein